LALNLGRHRSRAAVAADDQGHIHRVLGPGQARARRPRVEKVSQGDLLLDLHVQAHPIDDPSEGERPIPELREGAGRDGGGEGPHLEGDRLSERIDPLDGGAAQGDEGMKIKGIFVGRGAEGDFELRGAEGEEGHPRRRRHDAHADGPNLHRDRSDDRVGGRVDHRNVAGTLIRDIGVFPVRGDGDPNGVRPHRDRKPVPVKTVLVAVSITETVLELPFAT